MKSLYVSLCALFLFLGLNAQILHTVNSGNFYYLPNTITINVGDTIRWLNDGGFHNVNADINTLALESYNNPESFSSTPTFDNILLTRVFNVEGIYQYDCSVGQHAANGMIGTVIVEPASVNVENNDRSIESFVAYYNRHQDELNISLNFNGSSNEAKLIVMNLAGQNVMQKNFQVMNGSNAMSIDPKGKLTTGIYIIALKTSGDIRTNKLVIE